MDEFLAFVLAVLSFAFFLFLTGRAVKYVLLVGGALIAYFMLLAAGVLG